MLISLKVVKIALVDWDCNNRSATRARRRLISGVLLGTFTQISGLRRRAYQVKILRGVERRTKKRPKTPTTFFVIA
jgi:hypothetical protein